MVRGEVDAQTFNYLLFYFFLHTHGNVEDFRNVPVSATLRLGVTICANEPGVRAKPRLGRGRGLTRAPGVRATLVQAPRLGAIVMEISNGFELSQTQLTVSGAVAFPVCIRHVLRGAAVSYIRRALLARALTALVIRSRDARLFSLPASRLPRNFRSLRVDILEWNFGVAACIAATWLIAPLYF